MALTLTLPLFITVCLYIMPAYYLIYYIHVICFYSDWDIYFRNNRQLNIFSLRENVHKILLDLLKGLKFNFDKSLADFLCCNLSLREKSVLNSLPICKGSRCIKCFCFGFLWQEFVRFMSDIHTLIHFISAANSNRDTCLHCCSAVCVCVFVCV